MQPGFQSIVVGTGPFGPVKLLAVQFNLAPGAGVRDCKYGAEYDEVTGQCVCRFDCRRLYRPVCGTDGKGYVNDCAMAAAACESQREIRSIDSSMCLEYDSDEFHRLWRDHVGIRPRYAGRVEPASRTLTSDIDNTLPCVKQQ
ncbi:hypothetical protein Bbelb_306180 [Branchiostoma belcheri]|nr:hypothetical protein Bbelb_306180 [Branchiostoma belcheri]